MALTAKERLEKVKERIAKEGLPIKVQSRIIDTEAEERNKKIQEEDRQERLSEAIRRTMNIPQAFGEQVEKLTPEPIKEKVKQFGTELKDYGKFVGSGLGKKALELGEAISWQPKKKEAKKIFDNEDLKKTLEGYQQEAVESTPSLQQKILNIPRKKELIEGLVEGGIPFAPKKFKTVLKSGAESVLDQVEGLTTPGTISEIAVAGLAGPAGAALFMPDLTKGVKEGGKKAYKGLKEGRPEDIGSGLGEVVGAGAGILGITKGLSKGLKPSPVESLQKTPLLLEAPKDGLKTSEISPALPPPKTPIKALPKQLSILEAPKEIKSLPLPQEFPQLPQPKKIKTPFYSEATVEPFQTKTKITNIAPVESDSSIQEFEPYKTYKQASEGEPIRLTKGLSQGLNILENEIKSAVAGKRVFSDIERGQGNARIVTSQPSTFPIQNLGTKDRQLKIIDKVKSGSALTPSENAIFLSMVDYINDKRGEVASLKKFEPLESRIANKFEFGVNAPEKNNILGSYKKIPLGFTADLVASKKTEVKYPDKFSASPEKPVRFKPKITIGADSFPEVKDYVNDVFSSVKKRLENEKGNIDFTKEVDPLKADAYKYANEMLMREKSAKDLKKQSAKKTISETLDSFMTDIVDEAYPIEKAVQRAQKNVKFGKTEVTPFERVRYSIDRVYRSKSLAEQFMKDNGLHDIIQKAPDLSLLDQYLKSKRAVELFKQKKETGRDPVKDQFFIEQMAPEYEPLAKDYEKYKNSVLDYLVSSDLISSEFADSLKKENPNYVPFNRIIDEVNKGLPSARKISHLSKQSVIQKMTGSDLPIENIFESTVLQTIKAFSEGERNKSARALYNASLKLPELAESIQEVAPSAQVPNYFDLLDSGVKRRFATTKEISDAARNLEPEQIGLLMKIVNTPVRIFKTGTTGLNPVFVLRNFPRDIQTAIVNSPHGYKLINPKTFFESLSSVIGENEFFNDMVRQGALNTSFDTYRNPEISVKKIRAGRSRVNKIKYTATNPSEVLRISEDIVGISEQLPRAMIYKTALNKYLNEGFSLSDAKVKATIESQWATANFLRRGKYGRLIGSLFPYLRAGIQGQRIKLESVKRNPLSYGLKTAPSLLAVAALTAWALSDKKRKEAYDDIMDYEKENNFIFIPENPSYDSDKKQWGAISLPMSQELQSEASILREVMERILEKDPIKAKKMFDEIVGLVSPMKPNIQETIGGINPVAKSVIQAATNKDLYTGKPTVWPNMERKAKIEQFYPWTSGTIRKLSHYLGTSPLKTEKFIKDNMGSIEPQVFNLIDRGLSNVGILSEDEVGGKSMLEAIKEAFILSQGGQNKIDEYNAEREKTETQRTEKFLKKQQRNKK